MMMGLVAVATPLTSALAQDYPPGSYDPYASPPPPPQAPYEGQYQAPYQPPYDPQYAAPPLDGYATTAPQGYDGSQPPPPPPGY